VTTVLPEPAADGPPPGWTHLRIFKLKNRAAVEGLSAGLDAATLRVVPDEAQRKANRARSAEMRDFVRREVWTTLRQIDAVVCSFRARSMARMAPRSSGATSVTAVPVASARPVLPTRCT
jgi:hypothetical protein